MWACAEDAAAAAAACERRFALEVVLEVYIGGISGWEGDGREGAGSGKGGGTVYTVRSVALCSRRVVVGNGWLRHIHVTYYVSKMEWCPGRRDGDPSRPGNEVEGC